MGRVGTGGVVTGMAVMLAHPCHRQFCVVFLFLQVSVLAVRGNNRSQDRTGHSKKKAHSHIERESKGKATRRVVWHWGQGRCRTMQLVGDGAVMLAHPRCH